MRTPARPGTGIRRRVRRDGSATVALTVALALAVAGLAGCAPEASPAPPPATGTVAPTAVPTAAPAPQLVPEGTAADNLPLFAHVVAEVTAAGGDVVSGRSYIDALVAAGFDRASMQLTADTTTVGDAVDALQFSVLWAGECLVGQVGPSTPAPAAIVLPELADGGCLVGQTEPIDW